MSNFIKLSDLKEKKLKAKEMGRVGGGYTSSQQDPIVQDYGIVEPQYPSGTPIEGPIVQDYGVVPPGAF